MGAKKDESKPLSQKEYLKRYLSGESRKKKKKIAPSTIKRTKIIDDDIDLKVMEAPNGDVNIYDLNEDAPQVVAFVDERPKEVRDRERFATSRWKALNADDDDNQGTDSTTTTDQKSTANLQEADKNLSRKSKTKSPKKDIKRIHRESKAPSGSKEKLETTLDGRKAGLQDAKNLKLESTEYLRKEKEAFEKIDKSLTGENVAPIVRDRKTGKQRDLKLERIEQREKEKEEEKLKEKYYEWGKGLKQVEDAKEKHASDLHEMSKPLARYADDADLEKHLKDKERIGDPMLDYIRKKKQKNQNKDDLKPTYTGHGTSNRFGIHPGYRWDGVDRSNGYEKKWFEQQNKKAAALEEAYLWSVADM